jgi:hypothetical protein
VKHAVGLWRQRWANDLRALRVRSIHLFDATRKVSYASDQSSTVSPGTRSSSRTSAVTIVNPWATQVAASQRSCGPMIVPVWRSFAQICACALAQARSTGNSGKRSRMPSTKADRFARTSRWVARGTP